MSSEGVEQVGRSADRIYAQVKEMAITYTFRPGERINEVELARQLNVSRTPLREALNRLVSEGFLTVTPNRGFFCREFDPNEIFDLYQLRIILERAVVRVLCEKATQAELEALKAYAESIRETREGADATTLLSWDESFHVRMASTTHNAELVRALEGVNSRIRFARWIDMQARKRSEDQHVKLVEAIMTRDVALCEDMVSGHISRRFDQILEVIKAGVVEIYVGSGKTRAN